ncbi:ankyrin repeat-containing domain protein [Trichophaea hybrida]|nr:ankyrin repeat-containing domain protein [Trichophaea hybrida]
MDGHRKVALCIAIENGDLAVIRKLLDCGADISTSSSLQQIPETTVSAVFWYMIYVPKLWPHLNDYGSRLVRFSSSSFATLSAIEKKIDLFSSGITNSSATLLPTSNGWKLFAMLIEMATFNIALVTLVPYLHAHVNGLLVIFCMAWAANIVRHRIMVSGRLCLLPILWIMHNTVGWGIAKEHVFRQVSQNEILTSLPGKAALNTIFGNARDDRAPEIMLALLTAGIELGDCTSGDSLCYEVWCWAAENGYVDVIQTLLGRGVPVDIQPRNSRRGMYHSGTALLTAVTGGHYQLVEFLLQNNANIYATSHTGDSLMALWALRFARISLPGCEDADLSVLKLLLHYGYDPNYRSDDGSTPLIQISRHCWSGYPIRELLSAGASASITSVDDTGRTCLHYASQRTWKVYPIIQLLVEAGAPIDAVDKEGHTALWWAASWGSATTVDTLLATGAQVDLRGPASTTPLMEACVYSGSGVIKALLKQGADPNAQTDDCTPILSVLEGGNTSQPEDVLQILLDAGAKPIMPLTFPKQPLVEYAKASIRRGWVRALLQAAEGSVSLELLNEAFHACLLLLYIPLDDFRALLEAGADPAMHCRAGADPTMRCKDRYRSTPLHAVASGSSRIFDASEGELKTTLFDLIRRGADVNARDGQRHPPLHVAIANNQLGIVQLLLSSGARVDMADWFGRTALHVACLANPAKYMPEHMNGDLLQGLGANTQLQGQRGATAKYYAILGRLEDVRNTYVVGNIVAALLNAGADPLVSDCFGKTPLHYACEKANTITAGAILGIPNANAIAAGDILGIPNVHGTCREFLSSASTLLHMKDEQGKTPYDLAMKSQNHFLSALALYAENSVPAAPPYTDETEPISVRAIANDRSYL